MFNVAVLKMKDIKKYFIGFILTIILIILVSKFFTNTSKEENIVKEVETRVNIFNGNSLISCLEQVVPTMSTINEEYNKILEEDENEETGGILQEALDTQISSIKGIEKAEEKSMKEAKEKTKEENSNESASEVKKTNNENLELAKTGLATQIITNNPIKESYNTTYGNVKIKNETEYQLTEDMLTPNINIENKKIVLFHTHTCESYTSSEKYTYTPTGNFRTTDLNFSVARVGTELENQLKQYNYNVIHDSTYHDYPAYNGSYTRSLATVENILKENPSDIIIDVHRDAIGSRSDYAPIVQIGETDVAAQIMFVIGTNNGGLWHPNWNQNLKFAIKIQQKAEELYPGLFKPIMLTKSRYNQHTGKYASIIEVGATGNTLEQCLTSMKYLAKVISEVAN